MIDLHLHLDGSLNPGSISKMAEMSGISLPYTEAELKDALMVAPDCAGLGEYLEKFDLPLRLLQTADCIEYAVYDLIHTLHAQGLCYAEIRFAPQLHTARGLTQTEVVRAAICGLKRGMTAFQFPAQLILCCMRGADNVAENTETIRVAAESLGGGVCAVDLAGNEAAYPTEHFREIFALARKEGLPIIIHAGEAAGAESIRQALALGAVRIGHGIHAMEDAALMNLLRDRRIYLEMCYSSNLQTRAVDRPADYPIRLFLEKGLGVTVHTDNMTVSGTTLRREYRLLREQFALSDRELRGLAFCAAEAAFVTEEERKILKKQIETGFSSWLYGEEE